VKYIMARLAGGELRIESAGAVAVKALPWAFFIGSIGLATNSLVGNKSLVSKIHFPREVFPIGGTLAQAFDTSIGLLAISVALPFLGAQLSPALLWIPLLALLLFVMTVAAGLFLACGNLFFRDVKYIVQVLLTFGIFFTPVFFEPQHLGALGAKLIFLNPLAPILEGMRLTVIEAHNLMLPLVVTGAAGQPMTLWSPWYLGYSGLWALVGLIFSALLFHRLEFIFAEYA
jgi:ABC-type polysaccharide/polyol phosphate export permease